MKRSTIPYAIHFDTKDMAPKIVCIKVEITKLVIGPNDQVRVDLADHPLYPHLEQYVLANRGKRG